jgi:hypothetical protein
MDMELTVWIVVFVGGYLAVLGYLLRTAIWKGSGDPGGPPSA